MARNSAPFLYSQTRIPYNLRRDSTLKGAQQSAGIIQTLESPCLPKVGQGDLEVGTVCNGGGDWHPPGPRYPTLSCEGMGEVGSCSKALTSLMPLAWHMGASRRVWLPPVGFPRTWLGASGALFSSWAFKSPLLLSPPCSSHLIPSQPWAAALGCLSPQLSGLGGNGHTRSRFPSSTSGSWSSECPSSEHWG